MLTFVLLALRSVYLFFKPSIILWFKKESLRNVKGMQELAEETNSLKRKKGESLSKELDADIETVRDGEIAVAKANNSVNE